MNDLFILDPFGASPHLCVKVAQNGHRVLVAANNPVLRLLIEVTANPPSPAQARTALSLLSALRVRDTRVELHIKDLYQTTCPNCERVIFAEAFLWERDASNPYARIIRCEHCNTSGEFPLSPVDLQYAAQFSPGGLHYARALGRIAPPNDPDRIHVEEALNVYPPRAVYVLLTLINKLDQLNISTKQSQILQAMLLHVFDKANTLWPHPIERERPRQLTIPPTYRENNIWLVLEAAANLWEPENYQIPITFWPDLPPNSGGICLFEGRIKELAAQIGKIEYASVFTVFPRPNQAFWSLSALWAGWLWGREAVEHFKSVLRRRRYDWAWHSAATKVALENLLHILPEETTFDGVIGEAEPGFVTAVFLSAENSGLHLRDIAVYSDKKLVKISWQTGVIDKRSISIEGKRPEAIKTAARNYLLTRGEPSHYLQLHSTILTDLGRQNILTSSDTPSDSYNKLQREIQDTLNFRNGFRRFGGSEKSLDVGLWWLTEDSLASTPLSDRVEIAVVQYLIENPNCSISEVETALLSKDDEGFSGSLIPETSLIFECMESYGKKTETGWFIRDQDLPSKRREEINSMVELISNFGSRLGFHVHSQNEDTPHSIWLDKDDTPRLALYFSASALLGKFFLKIVRTSAHSVIVLPGGRANLVMFKLNRDPRLQKIFSQGWSFLKYRHARQLANSSSLTIENLESQLNLDPLTYSETQLRMF